MKILDGWNAAKERVGLETFDPSVTGGQPVQPKPDRVDIPDDVEWEKLTGQQRWYYKNREARIERKDRRRAEIREWLYTHKERHCECERCGEGRPPCLDFHHPDEKEHGVATMVVNGHSKASIREEIKCCIVLCANCHRIEHSDRLA